MSFPPVTMPFVPSHLVPGNLELAELIAPAFELAVLTNANGYELAVLGFELGTTWTPNP